MNRVVQIFTLVVFAVLLAAVLFVLIDISQNGIRLELAGSVDVHGMPESIELAMDQPVSLMFDEPAHLSVGGVEGGAIPASLSLFSCPSCGGTMLPVRWKLWTGEIEWVCTVCGEQITRSAQP